MRSISLAFFLSSCARIACSSGLTTTCSPLIFVLSYGGRTMNDESSPLPISSLLSPATTVQGTTLPLVYRSSHFELFLGLINC